MQVDSSYLSGEGAPRTDTIVVATFVPPMLTVAESLCSPNWKDTAMSLKGRSYVGRNSGEEHWHS